MALFIDAVSVNPEVTDAITQTNVKVVAEAPAQAMGIMYQTLSHSVGLSLQVPEAGQGGLSLYTPDPVGDGSSPPVGSGITPVGWAALIDS